MPRSGGAYYWRQPLAKNPNQHDFYLSPDLRSYVGDVDALKQRKGFSRRLMSIIARTGALYEAHAHEIRELFTTDELVAILAAIRGTAWTPGTIIGGIVADVEDGEGTAALVEKLRGLPSGQQIALLEVLFRDFGYE